VQSQLEMDVGRLGFALNLSRIWGRDPALFGALLALIDKAICP